MSTWTVTTTYYLRFFFSFTNNQPVIYSHFGGSYQVPLKIHMAPKNRFNCYQKLFSVVCIKNYFLNMMNSQNITREKKNSILIFNGEKSKSHSNISKLCVIHLDPKKNSVQSTHETDEFEKHAEVIFGASIPIDHISSKFVAEIIFDSLLRVCNKIKCKINLTDLENLYFFSLHTQRFCVCEAQYICLMMRQMAIKPHRNSNKKTLPIRYHGNILKLKTFTLQSSNNLSTA